MSWTQIMVTDLVDELVAENRRLSKDNYLLNQCLDVLQEFGHYLQKVLRFGPILRDLQHLTDDDIQCIQQLDHKLNVIINRPKSLSLQMSDTNPVPNDYEITIDEIITPNTTDMTSNNDFTECLTNGSSSGDKHMYNCLDTQCLITSNHKQQVIEHMKNDHQIDPIYECESDLCNEMFATDEQFRTHMNVSHKSVMIFRCKSDSCGQEFKSVATFGAHLRLKHTNDKVYHCGSDECDYCHVYVYRLMVHMNRHYNYRPFVCGHKSCGKRFKYKHHLKNHIQCLHFKSRQYVCDYNGCGTRWQTKDRRAIHVYQTHKKSGKMAANELTCPHQQCGKRFAFQRLLNDHNRRIHNPRHHLVCNTCHKKFASYKTLKYHQKTVHVKPLQRLKCPIESCHKDFKSRRYLNEHIDAVHATDRLFVCQYDGCDKRWPTKARLWTHISQSHRPLISNKCRQLNDKMFACDVCPLSFPTAIGLTNHKNRIHTNPCERFPCPHEACGKDFKSRRYLDEHIQASHSSESFACDHCDKRLPSKGRLWSHISSIHREFLVDPKPLVSIDQLNGPPFVCPYDLCGRQYDAMGYLKQHYRSHMNRLLSEIVCEYDGCGQRCLSRQGLRRHIKLSHKEVKVDGVTIQIGPPFVCTHELCAKQFQQKRYLKSHLKTHNNNNKSNTSGQPVPSTSRTTPHPEWKCSLESCAKVFKLKRYLDEHMQAIHSTERPFECEYCGKRWPSKGRLYTHVSQCHRNEPRVRQEPNRKYICEWPGCEGTFMSQSHLNNHLKTHRPLNKCHWPGCDYEHRRPKQVRLHSAIHITVPTVPCDWPGCDYLGKDQRRVREHRARHHLNTEYKYPCDWPECDKQFKNSSDMRKHSLIHTGRMVDCGYQDCQYSTSIRSIGNLKGHRRRIHHIYT